MADDVFSKPGPRYFSISSGRPFLKDFAAGLTRALAKTDFELPDATIYLPTRRAARALGEAFLETAPGTATLTPNIRTLGDIDDDEFAIAEASFDASLDDELALPPAVPTAQRRLMLARLIAEKEKASFDGQRHWAGAIAAADELGKLLDSLYTEEISVDALSAIVPETLAIHWQQSLDFLSIVTKSWPEYLAAQALMDPAARRVALINRQNATWTATPPKKPVIIAGTTGSTPAVARMMKIVAHAPFGCVVLPGVDLASPDAVWEAIDDPHPQSGLKALLDALEITRRHVRDWSDQTTSDPARADLVTMALRPANASDDWRQWAEDAKTATSKVRDTLQGLSLVDARDEEREANIIALKLRETIEEPGRTAMLVTLDRDLARRVAMKMRRWDVHVDDSAGAPFANTSCGIFLRLTASWLMDVSDPVRLMAMLDHPRFGGGLGDRARATAVGRIDRKLRGPRPGTGIDGLTERFSALTGTDENVQCLLDTLAAAAALWQGQDIDFSDRFDAHLAASELLCASDDAPGATRLWRGDDGEAGAALLMTLREGLGLIAHDRPEEYTDIFTRLIAGGAVRRRVPPHPRLAILGPLEARLQSADLVILAGLNEGVWPRDAAIDPFLSRPMRKAAGLPSPERRIGLAAHDFAQLAAAPDVLVTRSMRAAGKPTKSSRWIVRLRNILKGAALLDEVDISDRADALARMLDKPAQVTPVATPLPRPPVSARPTQFSVTRIEKLLRDPYAIYARDILRLQKLDGLDEAFGPRDLGNLLHKVLEGYVTQIPLGKKKQREYLDELLANHASRHGFDGHHRPFWQARIDAAFDWFVGWDANRRDAGTPIIVEDAGVWTFDVDGTEHSLKALADRIDKLDGGDAYIIDYKTGAPPSLNQTKKFSPQLPLTGLIVEQGGFADLGAMPVAGVEFVRILGRGPKEKFAGAKGEDASFLMQETRDGLHSVLVHFQDVTNGYPSQPRAEYKDDFGDFDHLARRRERNAQGESDNSGGDQP